MSSAMPDTRPLHLTKHHGAGNDFLVLVDTDDRIHLDPTVVRALCDRTGALMVVGADPLATGLLRSAGDWGT